MPTYDYLCEACGHRFEHFQSMSSPRLSTCPNCRKRKLVRLVGAGAGVIFKGSGFYETDYKRASAAKGKDADSSASGETTSAAGAADAAASKPAESGPPPAGAATPPTATPKTGRNT